MKRVGTDHDWSSIAAGSGFYLALKNDGTLWGEGSTENGVLGPGSQQITNGPVRIGSDADWQAVYASGNVAIGIKRDGSVWKWGGLSIGPNGKWLHSSKGFPNPIRWPFNGADWADRTEDFQCDLILKNDGTAWAAGWLPYRSRILGETQSSEMTPTNLVQIGTKDHWKQLAEGGSLLTAIKTDGTFVENLITRRTIFSGPLLREPSRYSDWLTAIPLWSQMSVALAADGTLSCWLRMPDETADGPTLLGPTRKPLWNLNILRASAELRE